MKILIANLILFFLAILLAIFSYFSIARAEVKMSASVGLTPENCITTCIAECENMTVEFGENYYKETINY